MTEMFSSVRSFLSRHRRKFVVTGIVIGGAYLVSKYLRNTLRQHHENEMKEILRRTFKQQHYDSIERLGNQTILSLSVTAHKKIEELADTESLVNELKKKDGGSKVHVFEKLKNVAFVRLTLLVYATSLMVVMLRLQINLIGGYLYRGTDETRPKISERIREKYLALNQFLITDGVDHLNELIREKVELVVSGRTLKEKLKLQDLEQILWAIHSAISDDARDPCKLLADYVLPPRERANLEPEIYQTLLSETRDLFESDEVITMAGSCVKRGFSFFVDNISEFFILRSTSEDETRPKTAPKNPELSDVSFVSIPMAKVIPIVTAITRISDSQKDVPSAWVQQLILMDDLKVLGANVYECFSA